MKFASFLALLVLLISTLSCRVSSQKKPQQSDPFYEDSGEGKFLVMPLLKPYQVVTDEGSSVGWQMDLLENPPVTRVRHIEKISVQKGVIMVFAPTNPQIFPSDPIWHWVVIVPDQEIEAGFADESDFLKYIQGFGVDAPNWIQPLEAFRQFEQTGCLSWIPNCE
ncbi:MAG: hypothetical protein IT314_04910 [Anaerolineales bacterium]|nr:hypothetical protein [Anaerolineales bacterium]